MKFVEILPKNEDFEVMRKLGWFLAVLILLAAVGGGAFLAFWDIPAPAQEIEKDVKYETSN